MSNRDELGRLIVGNLEYELTVNENGDPVDDWAYHIADAILARFAVVEWDDLKAAFKSSSAVESYFELRGRTEVSGNIRQALTPIVSLFPMGPTGGGR